MPYKKLVKEEPAMQRLEAAQAVLRQELIKNRRSRETLTTIVVDIVSKSIRMDQKRDRKP